MNFGSGYSKRTLNDETTETSPVEDTKDESRYSDQVEIPNTGKMYLILAFLGALFMGACSLFRSMVADQPFASMNCFALMYLGFAVIALLVLKIKNQQVTMPWNIVNSQDPTDVRFSKINMLGLVLGGLAEFGVSISTFVALNIANKDHLNAGLVGVLMPLNAIVVGIVSYFLYRE